ncbi:GDSL-type esterase/lipase family protein [Ekhidna sp.]
MKQLFIILLFVQSAAAQVAIGPSNPNILYTGRIDFTNTNEPVFSLSGVSIEMNFSGTSVSGEFAASSRSYFYVIIDGDDDPYNRNVIEVNGSTQQEIELVSGLSDELHHIKLVKLDESDSKVTFYGFEISGGGIEEKPERPDLQLEFIGDSNSAGWNAWNPYDNGGREVSGSYHTYPGMVSRMLGAEYSLIGASGSGVTDKASWNCTEVWDRVHLHENESTVNSWNFQDNYWNFSPSAIIVNLGANDYYANASKDLIKFSWKSFITQELRVKYPNTHIVLANSYGWALNEPADYVHEAIEELTDEGIEDISFVRFPWLWGQEHAVVNEHAGFANILAQHLAEELELEHPELLQLSSFASGGEITNGSFEKTVIPGIADGWRPHGNVQVITDPSTSTDGDNFLRLEDEGWVNFALEAEELVQLSLKVSAKSSEDIHTGFIKILFKDQAQQTIGSKQLQPDFITEWQEYELHAVVPANTWSTWIVLESANGSVLDFDAVSLSSSEALGPDARTDGFKAYPNPSSDYLIIKSDNAIIVDCYSVDGTLLGSYKEERINIKNWKPGLYFIRSRSNGDVIKFIKQ